MEGDIEKWPDVTGLPQLTSYIQLVTHSCPHGAYCSREDQNETETSDICSCGRVLKHMDFRVLLPLADFAFSGRAFL